MAHIFVVRLQVVPLLTPPRQCSLTLGFQKVHALDRHIGRLWFPFRDNAPAYWKSDPWFINRSPISVMSDFGQNILIASPDSVDDETENWHRDFNLDRIRFFNLALASHIR